VREDWFRRDRRILEIVDATELSKATGLRLSGVAEQLGLEHDDVVRGIDALGEAGYITFRSRGRDSVGQVVFLPKLRERARRELGLWPANSFDALVAALETRIAAEVEPAAKSKLEHLLGEVKAIGRDVLTDVITAVIKSSAGLP
jgi:DNA-binding MarR family transcriptional regulator